MEAAYLCVFQAGKGVNKQTQANTGISPASATEGSQGLTCSTPMKMESAPEPEARVTVILMGHTNLRSRREGAEGGSAWSGVDGQACVVRRGGRARTQGCGV